MEFLKIDGSYGEGGGQIIRTSVTLSCIRKKPILIENIRMNRPMPGLRAQHLTGIKLLAKICNAKVNGLEVGSTSIKFEPQNVEDCELSENIGTAGSISLILQVLIPAVSIAKKNLRLSIAGGTDVPWSPTIGYTKHVLYEAFSRMGIKFSLNVKKRGYYPKGGGQILVKVFPCEKLEALNLTGRKTKEAKIFCSFSKISPQRINQQIESIEKILKENNFSVHREEREEKALDKGGSLVLISTDSKSIIGSDGLFDVKQGKFKKTIVTNFLESNNGVDEHLADMIVLPASLIKEMTVYRVNKITNHLKTNLYVASKITGCKYGIGRLDDGYEVRITGDSDSGIQYRCKK